MTEPITDFGPGVKLGLPCPEADCDYEARTALALGAHRRQKHGTAGKKSTSRRNRSARTSSSAGSGSGPSSGEGRRVTTKEIAAQLEDLAANLAQRAPRTAEALKNRSERIAGAGSDLWAATEMGERVISAAGDEDKERLLRFGVAAAPVALTAFAELVAPRLIGPLAALWQRRRRRVVQDNAGNSFLIDRRGDIYTMDGTPTGQNINDVPAGPEPAPHAPEPEPGPAPAGAPLLVEEPGYWPVDEPASAY